MKIGDRVRCKCKETQEKGARDELGISKVGEEVTRDRLLALLKDIEFADTSGGEYSSECPSCHAIFDGHEPGCELRAAIDWLEDDHNARDNDGYSAWMLWRDEE